MSDSVNGEFSREAPNLSANALFDITEFRNVTSADQLDELVPGVLQSASSAFGDQLTPKDIADHRAHMMGDRVWVASAVGDNLVVGYSSVVVTSPHQEFQNPELTDHRGLYLSAVAVHQVAQGKGLSQEFFRRGFEFGLKRELDLFFTRTQNPRVEEGFTHSLELLVQAKLVGGFSVSRIVQKGVYGEMLTDKRPVARGLTYTDIDYERGDAAIIAAVLHTQG